MHDLYEGNLLSDVAQVGREGGREGGGFSQGVIFIDPVLRERRGRGEIEVCGKSVFFLTSDASSSPSLPPSLLPSLPQSDKDDIDKPRAYPSYEELLRESELDLGTPSLPPFLPPSLPPHL